MSTYGAELVKEGENLLHHCNTGALATMGAGTALGVIRKVGLRFPRANTHRLINLAKRYTFMSTKRGHYYKAED